MVNMFLSNRDEMRKFYREPCIDVSCKIIFILPSSFRAGFLEIDQPETRIVYIVYSGHVC